MEKTGITRRIDELGRIVIPKEIRRNLRIKSTDELEIRINNDSIVLSKYEGLTTDKIIHTLIYTLHKQTKKNILFTSKDKIIDFIGFNIIKKELKEKIVKIINKREEFFGQIDLLENEEMYFCCLFPIIINGDLIGSIIMYSLERIIDNDFNLLHFCYNFLVNYLE